MRIFGARIKSLAGNQNFQQTVTIWKIFLKKWRMLI